MSIRLPQLYKGVVNGIWKKYGSRKILVKFHGSRSLVFLSGSVCLAVAIFLQSRFGASILVSQSKNSKRLGLAEKISSLAVSQSLEFTIRHPFTRL